MHLDQFLKEHKLGLMVKVWEDHMVSLSLVNGKSHQTIRAYDDSIKASGYCRYLTVFRSTIPTRFSINLIFTPPGIYQSTQDLHQEHFMVKELVDYMKKFDYIKSGRKKIVVPANIKCT